MNSEHRTEPLKTVLRAAGGVSALAKRINISVQAISQWRQVPGARVIQVERALEGKVPRHLIRPDLYPVEVV